MKVFLQPGLSLNLKITSTHSLTHSLTLTQYFPHLRITTSSCSLFISLSLSHTHIYISTHTFFLAHTQTRSLTHSHIFSHTHKRDHSITHLLTHTKSASPKNLTQHLNISQSAHHRHNCRMLVMCRSIACFEIFKGSPLCVRIKTKSGNSQFWCHQFKINILTVQPISSLSSSWVHFYSPEHLLCPHQQPSNREVGVLQVLGDFLLN